MLRTVNLIVVEVKIDTFTDLMVSNTANKALQMKFLVESLKNLAIDFASTLGTHLCEQLVEVFVAIGFVIVFVELVAFKRLPTLSANEMVRMP